MKKRRRFTSLAMAAALMMSLALPMTAYAAGLGVGVSQVLLAGDTVMPKGRDLGNFEDVTIVEGPGEELWLVGLRANARREQCTTAEQLAVLFDPEVVEAILVSTRNGVEREPEDLVGTGDVVTVYFWDGSEAYVTLIVTGDVLGTGMITIAQVVRMAAALNGSQPFDDVQLAAAAWSEGEGFGINSLVQEAQALSGSPGSASIWTQTPGTFVHEYSRGGILIDVAADGAFRGSYRVLFRGDTGPGYPNGTRYYCNFTGAFSQLQKRAEGAYECTITALNPDEPYGTESFDTDEDGTIRYVCEAPWSADRAFLFGPGCAESTMEYLCGATAENDMLSGGKLRDGIWLLALPEDDGYPLMFDGRRL